MRSPPAVTSGGVRNPQRWLGIEGFVGVLPLSLPSGGLLTEKRETGLRASTRTITLPEGR